MFNKLKLILNNGKIMRRVAFTLLILFIYKAATWIPVPLLDTTLIKETIKGSGFIEFMDAFSGGALGRYSIVALGISPYITASIVTQLLQMDIIPIFKQWGEEGETGKAKLNQVTRYIAVGLAFVQSIVLILGISSANPENMLVMGADVPTAVAVIYMSVVMTAGTAFVLWLADLITRKGVGNGSSMIIAAGILTSLPSMISTLWNQQITNGVGVKSTFIFWFIMFLYVVVLIGVIYMQIATRKIPTQYANRQGKSDSNIPIKLNTAGVIPVIFASTLMGLPMTFVSMANVDTTTGWGYWIDQIFVYTNPIGFMLYIFLIFIFTFFYSFLIISPEKIADNLQKQNAFIPGVRPGEDTQDFIARVLFKITMLGATYLAILAIIPIVTSMIFDLPSVVSIGGTSLLIIVGVAVETIKQLETEATEKTYKGFM